MAYLKIVDMKEQEYMIKISSYEISHKSFFWVKIVSDIGEEYVYEITRDDINSEKVDIAIFLKNMLDKVLCENLVCRFLEDVRRRKIIVGIEGERMQEYTGIRLTDEER